MPPVPDLTFLPGLASFFCRRREHITALWMERVRQSAAIRAAADLDATELADHLPLLFDDLADRLRGTAATEQQAKHAQQHGAHRWQQEYSLTEVVRELSILCCLVLVHGLDAFHEHPELTPEQVDAAREVILSFFEDTTAASVDEYTRQQQAKRDALHRQATEIVQASEAKYRSIFNAIDQGYCVIEMLFDEGGQPVDYLFLEVNPAFEPQTGLKAAVGKRIQELAPDLEDDWFKIYGRVATTGLPARFEHEAAALGRWYEVNASRVEGSNEHHVAIAFTDITARRTEEVALRAKEAASRFLADLTEATRQRAEPDAVLGLVVDRLQTHLSTERCAYAEVEEDQATATIRYERVDLAGNVRSLAGQHRLSDFGPPLLSALRTGRTVTVADVTTDPLVAGTEAAMAAVGVAAFVSVPLVKAGRLVAVLSVSQSQARRWTADEVALIEAVAERSWGEVERARQGRELAESEAMLAKQEVADARRRNESALFGKNKVLLARLPVAVLHVPAHATRRRVLKEAQDALSRPAPLLLRGVRVRVDKGVQSVAQQDAADDAQFRQHFLQAVVLPPTMLAMSLRVAFCLSANRVSF